MTLIAHIADTHLGYRQYGLYERERDLYKVMDEIREKILSEHVKLVLHCGDFFHSYHPPLAALKVTKNFLRNLHRKGIKIYAIPGDHDFPKRRALLPHRLFDEYVKTLGVGIDALVDRVEIDGKTLTIAGARRYSLVYKDTLLKVLDIIKAKTSGDKDKILMLHQAVYPFLGYERACELHEGNLPKGFLYYAMGHIHQPAKKRLSDGSIIAYPGSTEIIDKREIEDYEKGKKGFYLVDISGDVPEIHRVKLESIRPQLRRDVLYTQLEQQLLTISKEISERYSSKPIIHFRVSGRKMNREHVMSAIMGILNDKILHYRIEYVDLDVKRILKTEEVKVSLLDIKSLMREELSDPKLAEFAYELYTLLARGGKTNIEAAKMKAKHFLERGEWK